MISFHDDPVEVGSNPPLSQIHFIPARFIFLEYLIHIWFHIEYKYEKLSFQCFAHFTELNLDYWDLVLLILEKHMNFRIFKKLFLILLKLIKTTKTRTSK